MSAPATQTPPICSERAAWRGSQRGRPKAASPMSLQFDEGANAGDRKAGLRCTIKVHQLEFTHS